MDSNLKNLINSLIQSRNHLKYKIIRKVKLKNEVYFETVISIADTLVLPSSVPRVSVDMAMSLTST
jgi:hypothetical protein